MHPVSKEVQRIEDARFPRSSFRDAATAASDSTRIQLGKTLRCREGAGLRYGQPHLLQRVGSRSRSWLTSGPCIVLIFFTQTRLTKRRQLAWRHAVQKVRYPGGLLPSIGFVSRIVSPVPERIRYVDSMLLPSAYSASSRPGCKDAESKMCIKIVEIYKICRCVYYTHAVDPCPAYGHRGHCVMTKNVLVGYTCSRHSINLISEEFIDDAGDPTTRPEDSRARNVFAKHQDGLERSTEEGTIDTSLRGRLLARVQKVLETDEQFIPAGDLDGVLTGLTIKRELQNQGLGDVSDHVFRHAKRIFAILLVIQKLDTLKILIEEGLGDEVLPIAVSVNGLPKDKKLQSAFSEWDLDTTKQFADFQWTVLAPVFSEGMHLKLHDDARLPFLRTKRIANGAYGGVHRVEIHCNHLNFMKFESPISTEVSLKYQ